MKADDNSIVRDLIDRMRREIDEIDSKIIVLVGFRTELAAQIARLKRSNNIPIIDGKRERVIVGRYGRALGSLGRSMASALLSKNKLPEPPVDRSSPTEDGDM